MSLYAVPSSTLAQLETSPVAAPLSADVWKVLNRGGKWQAETSVRTRRRGEDAVAAVSFKNGKTSCDAPGQPDADVVSAGDTPIVVPPTGARRVSWK